ncbi:Sec-independent protein translocase protein TatB [Methylobacterium brachythecii]|uniref:Sec-independent protein translocase protein TatB n=1 Tax=Methylobacterium brachythecii TaxID=1176177 RepID=A0A7W6F7I7_9HYPH|nr:Sec-independent protein translocase protein TatB [Methylobacterium brachythecii]MBB3903423.1 sec-independent protein translocase protein TatB [Methylobacterium brachythecii]GLS45504.1 sec-independent protein translocase protein TatB [Methylobacterium brachythecii]
MLDFSWGEVMLIGGVALIVIGPKDLPKALRTVGQVTSKVRRMAGEFQHQFNEAIREAELDDIKRDVEGVKRQAESFRPSFNPVDTIRNELKSAVEGRTATKATDPAPDLMQSTAPAAIAGADDEATERLSQGGSYDVPRPTELSEVVQPETTHVTPPHAQPSEPKPSDGQPS